MCAEYPDLPSNFTKKEAIIQRAPATILKKIGALPFSLGIRIKYLFIYY